jgi:hypothetical protein
LNYEGQTSGFDRRNGAKPTTTTSIHLLDIAKGSPTHTLNITAIALSAALGMVEHQAREQERERLKEEAFGPYLDDSPDGVKRGVCQVCGEDGLKERDVEAFFAKPVEAMTDTLRERHTREHLGNPDTSGERTPQDREDVPR